jgi:hypothetical protein
MARPNQIPPKALVSVEQARSASYVGSKEHKAKRWWGGLPGANVNGSGVAKRQKRQLTTICHMVNPEDRIVATNWVRQALLQGQYRSFEGDKIYPKHIWFRDGADQYWFGFCINSIAGTYKGWPIDEEEKLATFG